MRRAHKTHVCQGSGSIYKSRCGLWPLNESLAVLEAACMWRLRTSSYVRVCGIYFDFRIYLHMAGVGLASKEQMFKISHKYKYTISENTLKQTAPALLGLLLLSTYTFHNIGRLLLKYHVPGSREHSSQFTHIQRVWTIADFHFGCIVLPQHRCRSSHIVGH